MNHNERTETENEINRKLDALKAAVLSLVFMVTPPVSGVVSDTPRQLEEAWEEEFDD